MVYTRIFAKKQKDWVSQHIHAKGGAGALRVRTPRPLLIMIRLRGAQGTRK